MSLINKQSMTDKNVAAHRRNGRQSRGAVTAEGKERSRAAHLRHGFYSQGREEALAALGEDPAALAALIESTHAEFQPASDFQARLTERMARLWWRMERAERIQESLAARQVQEHAEHRAALAREVRQKGGASAIDLFDLLVEGAADPRFYTPRGCFRMFDEAFGEEVEGPPKEILRLMHRLRKPKSPRAGGRGARPGRTAEESAHPLRGEEASEDPFLEGLEEMDDDDFPFPWPKIPVAEGVEREELREELLDLAKDALETAHRAWDRKFAEHERSLSGIEQDEAQAAPHPHAELMRREEASCFRQFMRLGNFLLKLQKQAEKHAENEGPPGYVDENTENEEMVEVTDCPEVMAASAEQTASEVAKAKSEPPSPESEAGSAESELQSAESGAQKTRSAAGNQVIEAGNEVSEAGNEVSEVESARSKLRNEAPPQVRQTAA